MDKQAKEKILQELGIPEAMYDSLVKEWHVQALHACSQLSAAIARNDYEAIASIAHTIKGAAANLRIRTIADIAGQLEQASRTQVDTTVLRVQTLELEGLLKDLLLHEGF